MHSVQSSPPARDLRDSLPAVAEQYPHGIPATATLAGSEPVPFVLDLRVAAVSIRQRTGTLVLGLLAGAALGGAILLFVPARFDGRAMMLIRTTSLDPTAAVRGKMGPLAELIPGALGGSTDEELSTELTLLSSRAALGAVVDSMLLQAEPRSPGRVAPAALVDSLNLPHRFRPAKVTLVPGMNRLRYGTVWARRGGKVRLLDREDAIDALDERLDVRRIAGDAVEINYHGRDSLTAANVPNLVADVYMSRRRTVDRGLNQRRLEFLTARADSVRGDLRQSADRMARVAESNGIGASAEIGGRALAEEIGALEARLSELRADGRALDSLVLAARSNRMDARWLAGFPALLRSPALNDLVSQIARIETERTVLLGHAAVTSPQAMALGRARDSLVQQILPFANSYRSSLAQQRSSLEHDLAGAQSRLALLPAQTAAVMKEQAEITRLAQLNAGMGAQVLEARLAAMLEGGDVRVVDPAVAPRRVAFPRPMLTMAVCMVLGLGAGLLVALIGAMRSATTRSH